MSTWKDMRQNLREVGNAPRSLQALPIAIHLTGSYCFAGFVWPGFKAPYAANAQAGSDHSVYSGKQPYTVAAEDIPLLCRRLMEVP